MYDDDDFNDEVDTDSVIDDDSDLDGLSEMELPSEEFNSEEEEKFLASINQDPNDMYGWYLSYLEGGGQ